MDNNEINNSQEVIDSTTDEKPCTDPDKCPPTCSDECTDNCKMKNIAFLNYQYNTSADGTSTKQKSAQSNVTKLCVDPKKNPKFKMFKISCKEATEPNDVILYKVAIANTGNVPLTNVKLVDDLDNDTTYVAGSAKVVLAVPGDPDAPANFTPPVAPFDPLTIAITDPLPVGGIFIVSYKIQVISTSTKPVITNRATVTTTEEPTPQTDFVVIPSGFANVSIVKSIVGNPDCVTCGQALTYNLVLTNSGNIAAKNLVVTDLFDSEFCFKATDVKVYDKDNNLVAGTSASVDPISGLLTVNIPSLAGNNTKYTIVVPGTVCCC